jgi:Acetyl-CoA dehydrogenase C-terminal like/Acyl-CoA dehydrogenase, C-terminal domain
MLLAQKTFSEGALSLILYCAHLIDRERVAGDETERARLSALLGLLTPVAKSWPSEFGLAANDFAIQIHGGYGYTRDFDVEQVYRDNRLNPIHEGTHGIQGIDLLGRKIIRDKGASLDQFGKLIAETVGRAAHDDDELTPLAHRLDESWALLRGTVDGLIALDDPARALINASGFLSAFGHLVVAWLWLSQLLTIFGKPNGEYDPAWREGKLRACRYFIEVELPKTGALLAPVSSLNDVAATMPEEAF